MFKSAKVTTESGHNWTTSINGSFDEILSCFLGSRVDIGIFPVEKMENIIKVEVFGVDGNLEGEKIWFNYEYSDTLEMYLRDSTDGRLFRASLFTNIEGFKLCGGTVEQRSLFETLVSQALLAK